MTAKEQAEFEFRWTALRAGYWLGWLSLAAVGAGLALDLPTRQREFVIALLPLAAAGNAVAMTVPWRRWLGATRGRLLLDLWSAGLVSFATLVFLLGGGRSDLDLLFFLIFPFLATVHAGTRRTLWLAIATSALAGANAIAPLERSAAAMRAALMTASVLLALALARATRQEAAARADAAARAELEHALLAEAHHRVKNSLQTVADLLLLARPRNGDCRAFDDTATRIRGIASVHELLTEARGGTIDAADILQRIAAGIDSAVAIEAEAVRLEASRAQQLGLVANELIANAVEHGRPPVTVALFLRDAVLLAVDDGGRGPAEAPDRLGLQLVRQVVERGLEGTFTLAARPGGGTRATVEFPRCAS